MNDFTLFNRLSNLFILYIISPVFIILYRGFYIPHPILSSCQCYPLYRKNAEWNCFLMIINVENECAGSSRKQMHYLMFYSNCNIKNRKTKLMFRFRQNTWYMYFPFYKMPINYHADVNYKRPMYIL